MKIADVRFFFFFTLAWSPALWEWTGPTFFSTNQITSMSCSCADCSLLWTDWSFKVFSQLRSDQTVAPPVPPLFLSLSRFFSASLLEESKTAKIASLTSSSRVVAVAKRFGWVGDKRWSTHLFLSVSLLRVSFRLGEVGGGERNVGDLLPNAAPSSLPPSLEVEDRPWHRLLQLEGVSDHEADDEAHRFCLVSFPELVKMVMNGWRRGSSSLSFNSITYLVFFFFSVCFCGHSHLLGPFPHFINGNKFIPQLFPQ